MWRGETHGKRTVAGRGGGVEVWCGAPAWSRVMAGLRGHERHKLFLWDNAMSAAIRSLRMPPDRVSRRWH